MENETKNTKLSTPMAIIVAGFLVMVGIMVSKMPARNTAELADKTKDAGTPKQEEKLLMPVNPEDHIFGNLETAEVVLVEFSDTECPYCKNFHTVLHQAMTKYPGKIAWVYRHFPLDSIHPKTRMEARATECVASIGGNDKFWQYLDLIFSTTPSNNKLDAKLLPTMAVKVGVDKKAFDTCFASDKFDAKIEAQYEDGQLAGVQGTPHTIIITKDGTKIPVLGADEDSLMKALAGLIK